MKRLSAVSFRPALSRRASIAFVHDLCWAAASLTLALLLRVGEISADYDSLIRIGTPIYTVVAAAAFYMTGMYRGIWRYASTRDLVAITRGIVYSILLTLLLLFLTNRLDGMPRSLPVLQGLVLLVALGGPRFLYRVFKDHRMTIRIAADDQRIPVLLVGADDQSELFIRHCERHPSISFRPVAVLGLNENRVGREIHGIPVMGSLDQASRVLDHLAERSKLPQKLLLSPDFQDGDAIRSLLDLSEQRGLSLSRLPRLTDFRDAADDRLILRPIAVEDLLGRPQVVLDREGISALIRGRRVLITGAGGSIGSELVRQIAALEPSRLVLLDASEYALYTIDMEISERFPQVNRRAVIASVRDRDVLDALFAAERPEMVFHAAALKHVPLVEANPVEGLMTNAFGSRHVADACVRAGVRAMVMISTDKAVNPTNVMGASKRVAECWCQSLDLAQTGTAFVTVRFGNVLGSTGSVVPRFQAQLAAGGPLTVTHPDMVRYFMTIREAVELVLQASTLGVSHHDHGKIYVLDMGNPVKILDLANQMIRLAGFRPGHDIKVEFTGLRPGEKLFEEIFHGAEAPVPTQREGVLLASPRLVDLAELNAIMGELWRSCLDNDVNAALDAVRKIVPEFDHQP